MADSPVAYWRLGEASGTTAADEVGIRPGTYEGGFTLGQTGAISGDANKAVILDGVNGSHISIGSVGSGLTAFTFETWFKTSLDARRALFGTTNSYALAIGDLRLRGAQTIRCNLAATLDGYISGVNFSDSAWHHFACVWPGGTSFSMYWDGQPKTVTHTVQTATTFGGPTVVRLGNWGGQNLQLAGSMDEAAFYHAALTAAQILAHYNKGMGI